MTDYERRIYEENAGGLLGRMVRSKYSGATFIITYYDVVVYHVIS